MRRKQPTGVGAAMANDRDKLISLERRGAELKGKQTSVQQHRPNNGQLETPSLKMRRSKRSTLSIADTQHRATERADTAFSSDS